VVANDTDAEGDALAASVVAGPQHGTLSLDADGTFVYTPNRDFVGTDTFTYRVNDGHSDSNIATVTINLTAVNDAPGVNPERYVTAQNKSLIVSAGSGVLSNDTDAEGDSFSATLVTGPSKGQLTLGADGSFTYIPNSGYFGPDSFTYQASDGKQTSEATKVSLFVTNPNNVAPVAQNDSYTTAEDTVLLGQPTLPGGIIAQKWSGNGHYYAHVTSATHWTDAEAAAANMTFLGSPGHPDFRLAGQLCREPGLYRIDRPCGRRRFPLDYRRTGDLHQLGRR
jgi:VCBS repeat-containing protein